MFGRRGGGVTVQPILFHFGAVTNFSPPIPIGPPGGGGGGGTSVPWLLPLLGLLFLPGLLARAPALPGGPVAAAGPPPGVIGVFPGPSPEQALAGAIGVPPGGAAPAAVAPPVAAAPPAAAAPHAATPAAGITPRVIVSAQGPSRSGGARPAGQTTGRAPVRRTLPFTGANLWLPVAAGLVLIGTGVALRRRARSPGPQR
jgi:hypothetical protein